MNPEDVQVVSNMPDPIDKAFYSDMGRAGQILPAFIRIVCRARLECVPIEILDEARRIAKRDVSRVQRIYSYSFLDDYAKVLSNPIERIVEVVRERTNEQGNTPRFIYTSGKCRVESSQVNGKSAKTLCWSCPIISEIISDLSTLPDIPPEEDAPKPRNTGKIDNLFKRKPGIKPRD